MKEWWAARELAGLPELPGRTSGVKRKAQREVWLSRLRENQGGGFEYHVSNLPIKARIELARRWKESQATPSPRPLPQGGEGKKENFPQGREESTGCVAQSGSASAVAAANPKVAGSNPAASPFKVNYLALPEWARKRADARAEIVRAFRTLRALAGCTLTVAEFEFANRYNAGEIEVGDETRRMIPKLAAPTIRRWRTRLERRGLVGLADGRGHRRGAGAIDRTPEIRDFIVAMIADRPHLSARQVYAAFKATHQNPHPVLSRERAGEGKEETSPAKERPREGFGQRVRTSPARDERGAAQRVSQKLPSLRTVTRFMARWRREHAAELLAVTNPDAWNNRYRLAIADAASEIVRLNQRWEIDASPADAMCLDGRHCVIAVIDIYSRRVMFRVTKTVSACSATLLLRRAIKDWGVPEEVHGDNGKEFVSRHFQRALDSLAISWIPSTPFSGWEKPFVERVIGTVMHELFPMLPGFIGHSVADRQAIRSRASFGNRLGKSDADIFHVALTAEQLQTTLDRWARSVYANRPHSGLDDRTPTQAAAEWSGEVRRIGDERALDLLLAEAPSDEGMRAVGKAGIRVDGVRFFASDLAGMVGSRVRVLYDPDDMGRIYVYAAEGEFICIAENLERMGASRVDMAILAKQAQSRIRSDGRKAIRTLVNRIKPHTVLDAIIERAEGSAPAIATDAATILHETAALTAAAAAAEASSAAPSSPIYDVEALARGTRAIAELEASNPSNLPTDEELWERYQRLNASSSVSGEDRRWMTSYAGTPNCWAREFIQREKEREEEASGPLRAAG